MGQDDSRGLCARMVCINRFLVLIFGVQTFKIRPTMSYFPHVLGGKFPKKRKRPKRRRSSLGRKRKHSVGGGSVARGPSKSPRCSPAVPPTSRVRTTRNKKSMCEQTTDLSGETLWRARRMTIYGFWRDTLNCPSPKSWKGQDDTICVIMNTLGMPKGSYGTVHKVLQDAWDCHVHDVEYVGNSRQVGCDPHRQPVIKPGSVEEQIVADAVEDHVGYTGAMELVNSHIKAVDMTSPHVGRSSIKTVVDRLRPRVLPISRASQQCNLTADDPLGKARYEQLQQHRLRLGRVRLQDLCAEDQRRPAFLNLESHSYCVEQCAFWDEIHPVCRIGGRAPGPQSKIQRQFLRDINTQKLVPLYGINGDYSEPTKWAKVKYDKEIRLSLGCCLGKDEQGNLIGKRLPVFDYTNKWVVTITQFEEECIPRQIHKIREKGPKRGWVEGERTVDDGIFDKDPVSIISGIGKSKVAVLARMGVKTVEQLARLRRSRINKLIQTRGVTREKVSTWIECAQSASMGAWVNKTIDHRKAANPYRSRYGDVWRQHIRVDIARSGSVCITDLILHMHNATRDAFKDTEFEDKFFWYHDALTQLTCKRTRQWLVEEDLLKHWLLPVGPCNEGTVYYGRPVGNSPEIMPWDCSLNADVHSCVEFYSSVCKWIPKDHPLYAQRFSKASPKVMLHSYMRVLDPVTGVCPSSERIVQDITRCWGEHLDMICAEGGGAVKEIGNRIGRRKLKGVKKRGGKRVKKEWKQLDNLHRDMVGPWQAFINRSRTRHSPRWDEGSDAQCDMHAQ